MEYLVLAFGILAVYYVWQKKQKKGWHILWSKGVPDKPIMQEGDIFYIDIPPAPGHLNYIPLFKPPFKLRMGQRITARFSITGNNIQRVDLGTDPTPTLGMIIGRKGDKPREGKYLQYRWFSRAAQELTPGTYEMSVKLAFDEWGPVQGQKQLEMFEAALKELDYLGFVMGSAGGRGHGVYSTEPSRFTLHSLVVN